MAEDAWGPEGRWAALPGSELIAKGLADQARGLASVEALLVEIGAPRLRRAGVAVPPDVGAPSPRGAPGAPGASGASGGDDAELRLYRLLRAEGGDAYGRYNALLRRLVSFEQALEAEVGRALRRGRR